MDRDLLTPTFKKKRAQFLKYYQVISYSSLQIIGLINFSLTSSSYGFYLYAMKISILDCGHSDIDL